MVISKRVLDVVVAVIVLAVVSPLLVVIAVRIKREDGGPILYRGARVGRFGRAFGMFKFRTMVPNADKIGGPSTPEDDPRITGVGRWLRKYKLDELPQLINVLKGDMSLVGPRPEVRQYVDLFADEERAILSVRPGITDWASLWNPEEGALLAASLDPEKVYLEKIRPEKIRLQLAYVRRRSFTTDVSILWQTAKLVLGRRSRPMATTAMNSSGTPREA